MGKTYKHNNDSFKYDNVKQQEKKHDSKAQGRKAKEIAKQLNNQLFKGQDMSTRKQPTKKAAKKATTVYDVFYKSCFGSWERYGTRDTKAEADKLGSEVVRRMLGDFYKVEKRTSK